VGRRRVGDLDALLEGWARWLDAAVSGAVEGAPRSLLARWMDAKGHLIFSGGAPGSPVLDTVEARIELAVRELGGSCQLAEDVLRLEYVAGWWRVVERRGLRGYDPRGLKQLQNAIHLGVSVRTYRLRLAEARAYVAERLGRRP